MRLHTRSDIHGRITHGYDYNDCPFHRMSATKWGKTFDDPKIFNSLPEDLFAVYKVFLTYVH